MDAIRKKAAEGETPNNEGEHRRRTHSGFNKMVAPDYDKMKVCPDASNEFGEGQVTSVM